MTKQKRAKKKGSKEGILKQAEYARFVQWCATPDGLKNPKTQGELAKELNMNDASLSDWKNTDQFWPDVENAIKQWMKDRTQNVIGKLYSQALQEGKEGAIKLYLQYGAGFSEKVQVEDKGLAKIFGIEKMLRKIAGDK